MDSSNTVAARLATVRTSGTKETSPIAGMPARAWMQATSNSNNMTARNSRNESNNETAHTVGMPAKAGTLGKILKSATACRKTNYTRDTIDIRDISLSWMSTAAEPPKLVGKSATVEKPAICNRDASNVRDNSRSTEL
jgi:hypothetical protein